MNLNERRGLTLHQRCERLKECNTNLYQELLRRSNECNILQQELLNEKESHRLLKLQLDVRRTPRDPDAQLKLDYEELRIRFRNSNLENKRLKERLETEKLKFNEMLKICETKELTINDRELQIRRLQKSLETEKLKFNEVSETKELTINDRELQIKLLQGQFKSMEDEYRRFKETARELLGKKSKELDSRMGKMKFPLTAEKKQQLYKPRFAKKRKLNDEVGAIIARGGMRKPNPKNVDKKLKGVRFSHVLERLSTAEYSERLANARKLDNDLRVQLSTKGFLSYIYIVLDVAKLPQDLSLLTLQDLALATLYVGRGSHSRAFSHVVEAKEFFKNMRFAGSIIAKTVTQIWKDNGSVAVLRFQMDISLQESQAREACVIQSLLVENLKNIQRGTHKGISATWTPEEQATVGAVMLDNLAAQIRLAPSLIKRIFPASVPDSLYVTKFPKLMKVKTA